MKKFDFSILELMPDAVSVKDTEYRYIYANHVVLGPLDLTLDQIIGKKCYESVYGLDAPCDGCAVIEAMKTGKTARNDITFIDGKIRDTIVEPILDEAGEVIATIEYSRDITPRLEAEEKALRAEERYRLLIENSKDLISITDSEANTLWANPAWESLFGAPEGYHDSPMGQIDPRDIEAVSQSWSDLVNDRTKSIEVEYRYHVPNNKTRTFNSRAYRLPDKEEELYCVIARDITNERVAQKENEDARMLLMAQRIEVEKTKELSAAKTNLMNTAAHEIRTPITSIQGYVELIESILPDTDASDLTLYFDAVKRNATRLEKLSTDLLDMQRIESSKMVLEQKPVLISDILERMVIEMTPITALKDQEIRQSREIPDKQVSVDRTRIMQVLVNLVNNASQYSEEGDIISVGVEDKGDYTLWWVKDNGVGLSQDDISKLFVPFPDITINKVRQGTGLGLSICKGIISLHDGNIWAESDGLGSGSSFFFTIPIKTIE